LKGNYYRLLFLVGDAQKAELDEDLGGSYGYGKSVYASNSATSTIVTYSIFKQTKESNGTYARLLGSTFQKAFTYANGDFTGRGWFGGKKIVDDVPDPLVNEQAMGMAGQLGFSKRSKDELGTSILLIGTEISEVDLSIERIREAIETWWWPRYLEDRLDVELFEDGEAKEPPRPKQRVDLRPYIECYQQISNGSSAEVRVDKFNAHPETGHAMGAIALKATTEDAVVELGPDEPGPGSRRVAMIRSPLMVVDYHPMGSERREAFVGVYRAPAEIDKYLRLSEPKEHHRWDASARRLQQKPYGASVVSSVYRRCASKVRDFQASLAPKKEQPSDRLDVLDRLLGAAFAQKIGPPPPPPPEYGKALIEFPGGVTRVVETKGAKIQADIRVRLKPDEPSPQKVTVKPAAYILQDSQHLRGRDSDDVLNLAIVELPSGNTLASGPSPSVELDVFNNKWVNLRLVSSEYSVDWLTELSVTVE
jgi:hypothetical protein